MRNLGQVVIGCVVVTTSILVPSSAARAATTAKVESAKVESVRAFHWLTPGTTSDEPNQAGLGDWISLKVSHLETLTSKATDQKPLTLYINGLELPGLEPVFAGHDPQVATFLPFHLERTTATH